MMKETSSLCVGALASLLTNYSIVTAIWIDLHHHLVQPCHCLVCLIFRVHEFFYFINMPRCGYCKHGVPTMKGVRNHIQNSPRCRRKWERKLARVAQAIASGKAPAAGVAASASESDDAHVDVDDPMDGAQSPYRTRVEDVPEDEEEARRYVEDYPGVVATVIRYDDTLFEAWCRMRTEAKVDEWAPFKDEEEWEQSPLYLISTHPLISESSYRSRLALRDDHCNRRSCR